MRLDGITIDYTDKVSFLEEFHALKNKTKQPRIETRSKKNRENSECLHVKKIAMVAVRTVLVEFSVECDKGHCT